MKTHFCTTIIFLFCSTILVQSISDSDDSELNFCSNLPPEAWCDFGDDSLVRLTIHAHPKPDSVLEDAYRAGVDLHELILSNVNDATVTLRSSRRLGALRIFNCATLNLVDKSENGTSVSTLEVVNSTQSTRLFKFIAQHPELEHILLSGVPFTTDQLAESFGGDSCREVHELRLNHRCLKSPDRPFQEIQWRSQMFQSLCKCRLLDTSCVHSPPLTPQEEDELFANSSANASRIISRPYIAK